MSKRLWSAAAAGDTNQIAAFLASGGSVNVHIRPEDDSHPEAWETLLHTASRVAQEPTVAFLLQRGADPRALDWRGRTILANVASGGEAAEEARGRIAALLIAAGADVNAKAALSGVTALDLAAALHRSRLVAALERHGARSGIPGAIAPAKDN